MRRYVWMIGLVLVVAATATAQQPDNDRPERGRRGRSADSDEPGGRGERGDRERGRGEFGGGRFGGGGPGGMFRRPNPMFEALDANRDGKISEAELRKAVTALKKLDADGDGAITLAEASPQGGPGGPGGMGDPSQMVDRWMENDRNGDGKLTSDEVPEFMARMLQNADADGDGAVDKEELTRAAEQMRERFGGGRFGGGPGAGPGGPAGGGPFGGGDPTQWARQFDRNGDGKLTPDEVPDQVAGMLRASNADANGDGAIDADELRESARRMQERFGGGRGRGGYGDRGGRGDRGEGGRGEGRDSDRPRRPPTE